MTSVLFVCLGNICRSPTAESVLKTRAKAAGLDLRIDSAGTGGWHKGEPPDARAMAEGERRGYSFEGQSSRKVENFDFGSFDYILAMDHKNIADLKSVCPAGFAHKLELFLDYTPRTQTREVPDPYYGGPDGFVQVVDLIEAASDGLIAHIKAQPSKG